MLKKNGKWRICVDYQELNKATKKDHFSLSFIDQVLDGLVGKKFLSFLDGFSRYNKIQISLEEQDKTTFTRPWGTFAYQEALSNLGKVLDKCIEMNLSLSPEKCEFLMTEGIVLGHAISQQGLQVDPNKIVIIKRVPPPQKVRDVKRFLGLTGYYRRFIKEFSKLASPLFGLLGKDVEFVCSKNC
eukprot:PITA_25273